MTTMLTIDDDGVTVYGEVRAFDTNGQVGWSSLKLLEKLARHFLCSRMNIFSSIDCPSDNGMP
jgi:hypothetical protein